MAQDANTTGEEVVPESSPENKAEESAQAVGTTEGGNKGGDNSVPYDRFKEVLDQRKDWEARYSTLEEQFTKNQGELGQMIDLLRTRDDEANIVARIRELGQAGDEMEKELVSKLDLILQGKKDEIEDIQEHEEAGETKIAEAKTAKLLKETREEMEKMSADQQADMLLMKADLVAEKYMTALPAQYTDKDREIISTLLVDNVDWEAIEGKPDSVNDEVAKGFEKTLEFFGDPRGSEAKETEATTETTETESAPEVELPDYMTKEWGSLREAKDEKGDPRLLPEHSEDDFRTALAQAIRDGRGT